MKCEVCGKKEAVYKGYSKDICSTACFHEAGKTYDPSKSTGTPSSCKGG